MAFIDGLTIQGADGPARFGDVMAEFQRERFAALVPSLIDVAEGRKPRTPRHWWEATKGASKDSDLTAALLWLLAFSSRPVRCQIGAADQDQAREVAKVARGLLWTNPWLTGRVEVQRFKIVCDNTGGEAEILSADAAGSHGSRPDVLLINELSHIANREFAETLSDNLTKMPRGLGIIATNAGFQGTWQHDWREVARKSGRWFFHKLDRPAPWIDEADLQEARIRNSASRFNRLWYGVWSTGGGDALADADIEAAVTLPAVPNVDDKTTYFGGLDLGVKRDHSAFVALGATPGAERVCLAHCRSWAPGKNGVDLEAVERHVLDVHKQFRLSRVLYDPHQATLLAQRLSRQGVSMREMPFTGPNCDLMARSLLEAFRGRRIDLYDDQDLIRDLRLLSVVEKSFGHKLEAPRGEDGHADRAIALAIPLPTALKHATQRNTSHGGRVILTGSPFPVF